MWVDIRKMLTHAIVKIYFHNSFRKFKIQVKVITVFHYIQQFPTILLKFFSIPKKKKWHLCVTEMATWWDSYYAFRNCYKLQEKKLNIIPRRMRVSKKRGSLALSPRIYSQIANARVVWIDTHIHKHTRRRSARRTSFVSKMNNNLCAGDMRGFVFSPCATYFFRFSRFHLESFIFSSSLKAQQYNRGI